MMKTVQAYIALKDVHKCEVNGRKTWNEVNGKYSKNDWENAIKKIININSIFF